MNIFEAKDKLASEYNEPQAIIRVFSYNNKEIIRIDSEFKDILDKFPNNYDEFEILKCLVGKIIKMEA